MKQWNRVLLCLSLATTGCSVTKVQDNQFLGQCKVLLVTHYMAETELDRTFSTKYMLAPERFQPTYDGKVKFVGEVPSGSRVVVHEILRSPKIDNLGGPPYLRVTVQILDGDFEGTVSDVPSCARYHPRVRWITNCTLDPDQLKFNPTFARDCDASEMLVR